MNESFRKQQMSSSLSNKTVEESRSSYFGLFIKLIQNLTPQQIFFAKKDMGVRTRNNKKASGSSSKLPPQSSTASVAEDSSYTSAEEDEVLENQEDAGAKPSNSTSDRTTNKTAKTAEPTVYEVETILGKKFDSEGNVEYLVKWKSWNGDPTWEPEDNCLCTDLITMYEAKIAKFQEQKKTKRVKRSLSNSKKKKTAMGIKRSTRNKRLI